MLIILFATITSTYAIGQKIHKSLIELTLSSTRTLVNDRNTIDGTGFGTGFTYVDNCDKKFNIVLGIDLLYTKQLKKEVIDVVSNSNLTYAYSKKVNYTLFCASIPYSARYNFGKRYKAYVEAGAFIDLNKSYRSGTMFIHPDQNPDLPWESYKFKDEGWLSIMNYGPLAGFGFIVPNRKGEIIIKFQYRYGAVDIGRFRNEFRNSYLLFSTGFRLKNKHSEL